MLVWNVRFVFSKTLFIGRFLNHRGVNVGAGCELGFGPVNGQDGCELGFGTVNGSNGVSLHSGEPTGHGTINQVGANKAANLENHTGVGPGASATRTAALAVGDGALFRSPHFSGEPMLAVWAPYGFYVRSKPDTAMTGRDG